MQYNTVILKEKIKKELVQYIANVCTNIILQYYCLDVKISKMTSLNNDAYKYMLLKTNSMCIFLITNVKYNVIIRFAFNDKLGNAILFKNPYNDIRWLNLAHIANKYSSSDYPFYEHIFIDIPYSRIKELLSNSENFLTNTSDGNTSGPLIKKIGENYKFTFHRMNKNIYDIVFNKCEYEQIMCDFMSICDHIVNLL
jgi:hypothetical protein